MVCTKDMQDLCEICKSEKQVQVRMCPHDMCPDAGLCSGCLYDSPEDHSMCYVLGSGVSDKLRKRKALLAAGEYVLNSAINIGGGMVHAIFGNQSVDVGRYIPLEYYHSLPKNEVFTLRHIETQVGTRLAPSEYDIELE